MGKDSLEAVAAPDTNLARFYHHNRSNMTTQIRLAVTFFLQHSVLRYILILTGARNAMLRPDHG